MNCTPCMGVSQPIRTEELGCGLTNLDRFYHTRGHYPGHVVYADLQALNLAHTLVSFEPHLVDQALRYFPQFDGVASP